jgi:hypothetical protein
MKQSKRRTIFGTPPTAVFVDVIMLIRVCCESFRRSVCTFSYAIHIKHKNIARYESNLETTEIMGVLKADRALAFAKRSRR